MPLPFHLISDHLAPIPAELSARDRKRLAELREAYQAAARDRNPSAITTPEAAAEWMAPWCGHHKVEVFLVQPLDVRCVPIGEPIAVTRGDIDGCEAGPRVVFRAALIAGAAQVLIAHNHPTGNPDPSAADYAVTERLVKAGKLLDCQLTDHVVIGSNERSASIRRNRPDLFR